MCEGILTGLIESDEPGHYKYSRKGEIIRCPWHGWEFDVRTGQSYCEPEKNRQAGFVSIDHAFSREEIDGLLDALFQLTVRELPEKTQLQFEALAAGKELATMDPRRVVATLLAMTGGRSGAR